MVRVRGRVTLLRANDQFFIQQDGSGILVQPVVSDAELKVGDTVEVLGRITQDEHGVRRLVAGRERASKPPANLTIRRLTYDDLETPSFGGALVTVESEILSREINRGNVLFDLHIGDDTFTAEVPLAKYQTTDSLPEVGDSANFTGVARVHQSNEERRGGVFLETRSAGDVEVVKRRPMRERVPWLRVAMVATGLAVGFSSGSGRCETGSARER